MNFLEPMDTTDFVSEMHNAAGAKPTAETLEWARSRDRENIRRLTLAQGDKTPALDLVKAKPLPPAVQSALTQLRSELLAGAKNFIREHGRKGFDFAKSFRPHLEAWNKQYGNPLTPEQIDREVEAILELLKAADAVGGIVTDKSPSSAIDQNPGVDMSIGRRDPLRVTSIRDGRPIAAAFDLKS